MSWLKAFGKRRDHSDDLTFQCTDVTQQDGSQGEGNEKERNCILTVLLKLDHRYKRSYSHWQRMYHDQLESSKNWKSPSRTGMDHHQTWAQSYQIVCSSWWSVISRAWQLVPEEESENLSASILSSSSRRLRMWNVGRGVEVSCHLGTLLEILSHAICIYPSEKKRQVW